MSSTAVVIGALRVKLHWELLLVLHEELNKKCILAYFIGCKMEVFPFQNYNINLDQTYKTDLILWDSLRSKKKINK